MWRQHICAHINKTFQEYQNKITKISYGIVLDSQLQ